MKLLRGGTVLFGLAYLALFPFKGWADTTPQVTSTSGATLLLAPRGHIYQPYIADPHQPGNAFKVLYFPKTSIPQSGSPRYLLKAGGRFGLLRVHPSNWPEVGLQLDFEGGFDAQFDIDHNEDNIGWDGNYGLVLTSAPRKGFGVKLGAVHTSSHLGDEYIERTGRKRIGYRRLDLSLGVSWKPEKRWRLYGEGGWGGDLGNEELQAPGRVQIGVEFENPNFFWQKGLGWYIALDETAMEERDWRIDTSLQLGLMLISGTRSWRLGLEYYDGRSSLGEFFQHTESHVGIGVEVVL